MDIPVSRSRSRLGRSGRWIAAGAVVSVMLAAATVALGRLRSEPPTVARTAVWTGTVERGEMLREVQGNGKLVPEHIQWVTAVSPARVERIHVRPGTPVRSDTVLLELGNPDLELLALESERQVAAARAELASMRAELRGGRLAQKATVASLQIDQVTAKRKAEANVALGQEGYVSTDDAHNTRAALEALEMRAGVEAERLTVMGQGMHERLTAQLAQIRAPGDDRRSFVASSSRS